MLSFQLFNFVFFPPSSKVPPRLCIHATFSSPDLLLVPPPHIHDFWVRFPEVIPIMNKIINHSSTAAKALHGQRFPVPDKFP